MLFVVEHLEPRLSEWLWIEYSHAARIVGRDRLIITNVRKKREFEKLSRVARVERKHVSELFEREELLVLDSRARKKLTPSDFKDKRGVVIGGILGADPPLGRTEKLLTKFLKAPARNLGKGQFPIDGATYVAMQVSKGKLLDEVPIQQGVEIQMGPNHSVLLPYAYPLANGNPLISSALITYLERPWALTGHKRRL